MELIFSNVVLATQDELFAGSLAVKDGVIRAMDRGAAGAAGAIDGEGDYFLPGLIDVHTDNLEKHFQPRPAVVWPSPVSAVLAHDRDMVGAGVTTVYDALSLGDYDSSGVRRRMLDMGIEAVTTAHARGLLKADHFLHFRCEISDRSMTEIYDANADNPRLGLISLMDHTPGQRQWRDLAIYREFRRKKNARVWSDAEWTAYIDERREHQTAYAAPFRAHIRRAALARGVALASHDDTTIEDVDHARAEGVTISEFPTTIEAAEHARAKGLKIVMGGPNVVLGRSHSGNVSARDLAARGLLDALSSDYVPASLLEGAFALGELMSLPAAIATVTANPAAMLSLSDRGRLAPGLRADLVRVRMIDGLPVIRGVWSRGERLM
ncbi:MAG: phosphonate metabolism protein PhnM [Rhizobiales bacterium 65-9]|nr:alpha-D-ribose 1-methylphosphonate 5-triphosphate diphosphatase [Hyphomicrobiales bacterium]OJY40161.1 MAG: phosphonate metabolism protein PhnM [Rhizobiales bacterium 65-9]